MQSPGIDRAKFHQLIMEKFGSQNAFAEACGVSRQYIWQVVKGEVVPSLARIIQFSDMLDVKVDELLEKEEALAPA